MYEELTDREKEILEWIENGPGPLPEKMLPAEVCALRRAAENLNRLETEHKDTDKLTHAKGTFALKISQALSWGISWQCIGEIIGISGFEAEKLFDEVKNCKPHVTNRDIINSRYQGADCLKLSAENLFNIESNHASESEIAEAQIELIHRIGTATAWDISWSRISEIIGISGAEAEALFDRITEAAEARADAMEAAAQAASGRDQGLT